MHDMVTLSSPDIVANDMVGKQLLQQKSAYLQKR